MSIPFSKAPHIEGANATAPSPNAALLIDFDNVTMGMRSDLSKELKTLLSSDVIRGKVTVQRAYADWRRYPQYIVPLSEASIDLIFAPAYGSNKKNATDIRMAIDGIELVFTRPEIGTYILLTGDSDFSSLVLKLKEYGKYVIGVGIQESSSDILVQNCDEYYSYTALSGLRKADDESLSPADPWSLVARASEQMGRRGDVMRSDRLKQVMLEVDPAFDEKSFGFNKFSRFVSEAARRGLIGTRRMENGQYEILQVDGAKSDSGTGSAVPRGRRKPERSVGSPGQERADALADSDVDEGDPGASALRETESGLVPAYALLKEAVSLLQKSTGSDAVRDSDVKRRMLVLKKGFDETDLGFPKFSRFLQQAHDDGVVGLQRSEAGNYQVTLAATDSHTSEGTDSPPSQRSSINSGLRSQLEETQPSGAGLEATNVDLARLRLPTDRDSVVKYLSNSYGGVGEKTAETLVDALGDQLFPVLQGDPAKVKDLLPPARAERVLVGWQADYRRRIERHGGETTRTEAQSSAFAGLSTSDEPEVESRLRRGRRTRGGVTADG